MKIVFKYFLFCVLSVSSLTALTFKRDSLKSKLRVKRVYLGFTEGCNVIDLQYRYRTGSDYYQKTSSTHYKVENISRFTKFVFTYPGIELDVIGKSGFKMDFDLNYFVTNFSVPVMQGTTTSSYTQYGPGQTPIGSTTYLSFYEIKHESTIGFLNYSLGFGYSFPLLSKSDLAISIQVGDLKAFRTMIKNTDSNGITKVEYFNAKKGEYGDTHYNYFTKVKLGYLIPHKEQLVFTFGLSFYKVFNSENNLYNYPSGYHIDLDGLNMLKISAGIVFKINKAEN